MSGSSKAPSPEVQAPPDGPAGTRSDARARPRPRLDSDEAVVCERCGGANVYRMHAVWRCADCGYKTDCCGW